MGNKYNRSRYWEISYTRWDIELWDEYTSKEQLNTELQVSHNDLAGERMITEYSESKREKRRLLGFGHSRNIERRIYRKDSASIAAATRKNRNGNEPGNKEQKWDVAGVECSLIVQNMGAIDYLFIRMISND
ncbi:4482_t:CDS:2 [Funneliformis mosseae]|uniref:4482_t:CDS:1 n=1 Tax=Funneliformis mosseae TaxID=27381 RepID=A0A9N9E8Z5_FUNMO|nr:4482_t:CDS:2 [Funneliformis mosseae]